MLKHNARFQVKFLAIKRSLKSDDALTTQSMKYNHVEDKTLLLQLEVIYLTLVCTSENFGIVL